MQPAAISGLWFGAGCFALVALPLDPAMNGEYRAEPWVIGEVMPERIELTNLEIAARLGFRNPGAGS